MKLVDVSGLWGVVPRAVELEGNNVDLILLLASRAAFLVLLIAPPFSTLFKLGYHPKLPSTIFPARIHMAFTSLGLQPPPTQ